jgi:hypothetical protein
MVEAIDNEDCIGTKIVSSDIHPYALLSPRPDKPSGITVKNNELSFIEFDVPTAKQGDQWKIYRSDGLLVRIYSGQRLAVGIQPNENVNGKTFSYRIMRVIFDTWGEVWSEPSDPIVVKYRDLVAPTDIGCHVKITINTIECSLSPNRIVESTLIEYLDFDGVVLASSRITNSSGLVQHIESGIGSAVAVRLSSVTGKSNEWMRRGDSVTLGIAKRTTKAMAYSAH